MFELEILDKNKHARDRFVSQNDILTRYLHIYANQDVKRNLTKVYVAVKREQTPGEKKLIYGYFSLSAYSLYCHDVPDHNDRGEYKQIPSILLGRLAVQKEQTELYGYELLGGALRECKKISTQLGTNIVVIEAIDEKAKQFYLRQGFHELKSSPLRLYLPIKSIP